LIVERNGLFKKSFNKGIIEDFVSLYEISSSEQLLYNAIRLSRDIFGHSRISVNEEKIWYVPQSDSKLQEIKEVF